MELKELVGVFKKNIRLFCIIFFTFLFFGAVFFFFQSEKQVANLMINVTRKGYQQTSDYQYDGFYRLQADERFADTVVRWIGSLAILNQVAEEVGQENFKKIGARRLSSQMIEVVYATKSSEEAEKVKESLMKSLNKQVEKLDEKQQEPAWFMLVANDVEVLDGKIGSQIIFLASFLAGLFFAIFGVMMKNYLE